MFQNTDRVINMLDYEIRSDVSLPLRNDNSLLAKSGQTCLEYGILKVFEWVKLARLEILLYSVAVLRNDQVLFSSLLIQHLKNQGVNRFSVREQMFIFAAPLI